MPLDDALFLVDRDGTNYRVAGADIEAKLQGGDGLMVQREGEIHTYRYDGTLDEIEDTDLFLVWEDDQSKHVTGATFKTLFDDPFDISKCILDARTDYIRDHTYCESDYCKDIVYNEYINALKDCYDAAGEPYPPIWPPPLP
jgi:hypothetical protein